MPGARAILVSAADEDNPHIERLSPDSLLLFLDRARAVYYAISADNGLTWSEPVRIPSVINDQAPYDIQPHLWFDGSRLYVYFCADNENGRRSIYRAAQRFAGNWEQWDPKQLVMAPDRIAFSDAVIAGVGEPSLTAEGDLSFVVIYGDPASTDSTDVWDADPWLLPKKKSYTASRPAKPGKTATVSVHTGREIRISADLEAHVPFVVVNVLSQVVFKSTVFKTALLPASRFSAGWYLVRFQHPELAPVSFAIR